MCKVEYFIKKVNKFTYLLNSLLFKKILEEQTVNISKGIQKKERCDKQRKKLICKKNCKISIKYEDKTFGTIYYVK